MFIHKVLILKVRMILTDGYILLPENYFSLDIRLPCVRVYVYVLDLILLRYECDRVSMTETFT